MSLRDNSTMCLREILSCISNFHGNTSLFKLVVMDNMLPLIKTGIRLKTEVFSQQIPKCIMTGTGIYNGRGSF